MNKPINALLSGTRFRWLAAAGAVATLLFPVAASADHQNNDLVEIVASAAVAYVVVDAVGGFDDDRGRRHKRDRNRDYYRDQYDRYEHRDYSRHHRARVEHRRQHAYGVQQRKHHYKHYNKHQRRHAKHQREQSKHNRHNRRHYDRNYRAYH